MKKDVTIVEISVYENMAPLVSGYLQAYACADSTVRNTYNFHKYSVNRKTPLATMFDDIAQRKSDVYAFSCYIWNIGLVKSLLPRLMEMNPQAHFLLGGPQVMHHAHDYLDRSQENLFVCNAEGEKTFTSFLRELSDQRPEFSKVRGLSFYQDGELVTTEREERVQNLDDIPSPFLNGVFDDEYPMSVVETNRGCPYRCGFYFWGAATNDKVFKFSEERIREELTWLSRNNTPFLFIADANWGMLDRDIRLSEHIVECKTQHASPIYVYFSAAKNSPNRVSEITEIFTPAGLFSAQPISMQTLDETSLDQIDRTNIKIGAFEKLQEDLTIRG